MLLRTQKTEFELRGEGIEVVGVQSLADRPWKFDLIVMSRRQPDLDAVKR
jgi:hypothetical protein